MQAILSFGNRLYMLLERAGGYVGLLPLRLLLAWEFGEAGAEKFRGGNWFGSIKNDFPFPFNVIPADLSWFLATWSELLGAVALVIGLGTRLFGVSLFILTIVAWASVHAGNGYNICDNGWKLPLIYMVMFVPLILNGPGRLSLDDVIRRKLGLQPG